MKLKVALTIASPRRSPALLAALALSAPAGGAMAHAALVSADPAPGSVVAAAPAQLRLRFSLAVRPAGSGAQLAKPDGHVVLLPRAAADAKDPHILVLALPGTMAPGRYQVRWRALSAEAHHSQGRFDFSVQPGRSAAR